MDKIIEYQVNAYEEFIVIKHGMTLTYYKNSLSCSEQKENENIEVTYN